MPIRNIVTVIVAITLGILAVVMVRKYLDVVQHPVLSASTSNAPGAALSPVVLAAQPIARGTVLEPGMLTVANFPQGSTPSNSFRSIAALTGSSGKRLALRSFVPNEPILSGEVSDSNGRLNLSNVLRAGMRAISVRSNEIAGVGGFVLPGDHVDVILTHQTAAGEKQRSIAQVLAENALVLGVDQSDNSESDTPVVAKAVTIEVTPEQAQTISLGQSIGTVTLALRYVADTAPIPPHVLTDADLNEGTSEHKTGHRSGAGSVHVTRGTDVSNFVFGQTTPKPQQSGTAPVPAENGKTQP